MNKHHKNLQYQIIIVFRIGAGLFWTLTYIFIIIRGLYDKVLGIPVLALYANLAWEFIFSFIYPNKSIQRYINVVWFSFDLIIFLQSICYRSSDIYYLFVILGLPFVSWTIYTFTQRANDFKGRISGLLINFIMSVLFLITAICQSSPDGNSLYVSIFKMLGTLSAWVFLTKRVDNVSFLNKLYLAIFILDCMHISLIYIKLVEIGLNPWLRF